jgi:hypothetical protein
MTCAIAAVLVIAFVAYVFIDKAHVRNEMNLYLKEKLDVHSTVQSIEARHPWFSGRGEWSIEVRFYDEPDAIYFYSYNDGDIEFSKLEGSPPDNKSYRYLFDFQQSVNEMDTPLPVAYSYFANAQEALILGIGDQAMGTYALQAYVTNDGGKTWDLRTENDAGFISVSTAAKYLFLSLDAGFIQDPAQGGDYSRLLQTRNGGRTFEEVHVVDDTPVSPENGLTPLSKNKVYDYYELPTSENGILTLIVSQGSDGDVGGGKTVLEYQSSDMGETWSFIREYEGQGEGTK